MYGKSFDERVLASAKSLKLARVKGSGVDSALSMLSNIQSFVGSSKNVTPQTFKSFYGKLSNMIKQYNAFVTRLYKASGANSPDYHAILSLYDFKRVWDYYKKEAPAYAEERFRRVFAEATQNTLTYAKIAKKYLAAIRN